MTKNQNQSISKNKKLKANLRKVGFACIVGSVLSVAIMLLTSWDDVMFPLFFILFFSGILLIIAGADGKWRSIYHNKRTYGAREYLNPQNPFGSYHTTSQRSLLDPANPASSSNWFHRKDR
jgi:hypothetical protein